MAADSGTIRAAPYGNGPSCSINIFFTKRNQRRAARDGGPYLISWLLVCTASEQYAWRCAIVA